jgi:mercuric ion transport protein
MRSGVLAGLGGIAAAFLGSLCCVGPLLLVTFGVGAGFASTFEPLRPLFGMLMLAAFALGFYVVHGRPARDAAACAPGEACPVPRSRARDKLVLWTAAVFALIIWAFPTWSVWLV